MNTVTSIKTLVCVSMLSVPNKPHGFCGRRATCLLTYFSVINGSGPAYLSELLHVMSIHPVSYTPLYLWHPHAKDGAVYSQGSWLLHFLVP